MKKTNIMPIPVKKALKKLGEDIKEARIRRRISMQLMSERAGISRPTLKKVEEGDETTSMGIYAKVIFILGLEDNLANVADIRNDKVGMMLASKALPKQARLKKMKE
jgi:transcriptional regulator with XRE-family HTH domain